ncbi:MAG: NosD domain-containing protein [Candidatus Heimdallarchaeota archaeon]
MENNTVNGKPLIFWQNVDGGTVPPDAGQIILINSKRIEITGQDLSHTSVGVHVINSTNLTIHHNIFFNNSQAGIHLHKSWNSTVTNNTISDCEGTGIYLEYSGQSILTHNTVVNCKQYGIYLYQSEQSTLTHNIVVNSEKTGIYLEYSGQSTLTHNTVSNCKEAGIYLWTSGQNIIVENKLTNNGLVIYGNYTQTKVLDNVVNGSPLVFWQQVRGGTVPPGAGQVILINATGVEVAGQNLTWASIGLFAAYSSHLEIHHNTLSQNTKHGIWLLDSSQTIVSHNVLSQNGNGIDLWNSLDNIVTQNTVSNCEGTGIRLFFSNNDTTTQNTVSNCKETGIRLHATEQSTLTQNIVANCEKVGVYLVQGSRNILHNNTIINNTQGILLLATSKNNVIHNTIVKNTEYGITLNYGGAGEWRIDSRNNTIIGNDFLGNNAGSSSQGNDNCINNVFMNNYWDDHDNTDLNADGIADNPYPISGDAANQDLAPKTVFINPHRLMVPTLIFPNGGETVQGIVTLHWTPVFDTWGHSITYMVSYSADDGQTWKPLVVGLTLTNYEWDTTTVADGSAYHIKVVVTCSDGLPAEDRSDAAFTIQNQPSSTVSEFTFLKILIALSGLGLLLGTRKRQFR